MRLLIAEDDPRLLKSLVHIFTSENYSVDGVSNGNDAYDYALSGEYDGIVLDIMMPGKDGLEVLHGIREKKIGTPVLLLTAKTEIFDRVKGLDYGADDYLPKPFATSELTARVRAMIRRRDVYIPDELEFKGLKLNSKNFILSYNGEETALRSKEYQIMNMLIQQPEVIIPSEKIITHVWGWDAEIDISVIWVNISNLRKKIEAMNAPVEIRFIRNTGYILGEKQ